jgi:PAS domain S-box-containing protein
MVVTNPYTLTLLPVAGICSLVAGYAWSKRPTPGAAAFGVFNLGAAIWALGSALTAASVTFTWTLIWIYTQFFGVVLLPAAWFAFALDYTGRDGWLTRRTVAALAIEPIVVLALVWTTIDLGFAWTPGHGLFYTAPHLITAGDVTTVALTTTIGFWIHVAYSYTLVILGTALLLHLMLTVPKLYRTRTVAVLVSIAAPVALNLLFLAGAFEIPIDPTPYAYAFSGAVGVWALLEKELFDVPPIAPTVAHSVVFEQISDGVLIVDAGGRVVDFNAAAASLVGVSNERRGVALDELFPTLAAELEPLDGPAETVDELALSVDGQQRYFEITSRPIDERERHRLGRLITLHDVTDRILREQRLDVLHRVLRHNVRQETNKILGHADFLNDTVTDGDAASHVDAIESAAEDLVDWSNQARSIERTLGPVERNEARVDVESAVRAVIEEVRQQYPDATITTDLVAETWVRAHVSLQEALFEIVENAVEHGSGGSESPRVEITATRDGEWLELRVSDDGPGLPDPERRVFERGRETPLEHGSGLGLWLVSWTVRASRGQLDIETSDGTTVTLRLPLASAPDDERDEPSDVDLSDVDSLLDPSTGALSNESEPT